LLRPYRRRSGQRVFRVAAISSANPVEVVAHRFDGEVLEAEAFQNLIDFDFFEGLNLGFFCGLIGPCRVDLRFN
jgi:hypothetical protein